MVKDLCRKRRLKEILPQNHYIKVHLQSSVGLDRWKKRVLIVLIVLSSIMLIYFTKEIVVTQRLLDHHVRLNDYIDRTSEGNDNLAFDEDRVDDFGGVILVEKAGKERELLTPNSNYQNENKLKYWFEEPRRDTPGEKEDDELNKIAPSYVDDDDYPRYRTTLASTTEYTSTTAINVV